MLFRSTPSVYYGDEISIDGFDRRGEDAGCRFPFDWDWAEKPKSVETRAFYQKLIALRRQEKALREGSFKFVFAEGFTVAFARFTRKEVIFTIASMEDEERIVPLPLADFGVEGKVPATDCLGSPILADYDSAGSLKIRVPAGKAFVVKISSVDCLFMVICLNDHINNNTAIKTIKAYITV